MTFNLAELCSGWLLTLYLKIFNLAEHSTEWLLISVMHDF